MRKPAELFGKTVQQLRENLHITQEILAETCGLHPMFVSQIERGVKSPSFETILELARALRTSPGSLFELAFAVKGEKATVVRELLSVISQLDSQEVEALSMAIKAYATVKGLQQVRIKDKRKKRQ